MQARWNALRATLLAAGTALALAGCGDSPIAPSGIASNEGASPTGTAPPILSVSADGSVQYVPAPTLDLSGGSLASGTLSLNWISSSAVIDGSQGGTVQAGRFGVRLLPGSFRGPATITLTMPDSTIMLCYLTISPSSANKFKYPAELTANLSGLVVDASNLTMYWFDPDKGTWVSLFAKSKSTTTAVTAYLDHFSAYAAGKAGW